MTASVPGTADIEPLYQGSPIRYVRRLLAAFLQGVYGRVQGEYHWAEDPNEAGIHIAANVPVDAAAFGKRPCIALGRTPFVFAGAGIGGIDDIEPSSGAITKSDLINSVAVFHHISTKEAEAEDLACFTTDMLWTHFALLAGYYVISLGNLSVAETAPVGSLVEGETKGLITVPVTMPFRMPRACRIEPLGEAIFQGFTARLNAHPPTVVNYPSLATLKLPTDPADIRRKGPRTLMVSASQQTGSVRSSVRVKE